MDRRLARGRTGRSLPDSSPRKLDCLDRLAEWWAVVAFAALDASTALAVDLASPWTFAGLEVLVADDIAVSAADKKAQLLKRSR